MKGMNGENTGFTGTRSICACVCVYTLQCRAEKPEVSFSTACNPIRRITLLSQAI